MLSSGELTGRLTAAFFGPHSCDARCTLINVLLLLLHSNFGSQHLFGDDVLLPRSVGIFLYTQIHPQSLLSASKALAVEMSDLIGKCNSANPVSATGRLSEPRVSIESWPQLQKMLRAYRASAAGKSFLPPYSPTSFLLPTITPFSVNSVRSWNGSVPPSANCTPDQQPQELVK